MSELTAMDATMAAPLADASTGDATGVSESSVSSTGPVGGQKAPKGDADHKNAQFFMTILSNMTNRPEVNLSFSRQLSQAPSLHYHAPPSSINPIQVAEPGHTSLLNICGFRLKSYLLWALTLNQIS